MILSSLDDAARYETLHPFFGQALEYLRSVAAPIEEGKRPLEGDDVFAVLWKGFGKGQTDAVLECHRRYIDIQYVVSGEDVIGWQSLAECEREKQPYDEVNDLQFFYDRPRSWHRVPAGSLAIFYPEDVHAPLAGRAALEKVVVKVAIV
ncbi:MAG: YhcH/YjgK/YiaL family protein [Planctomycetota bacterium]